MDLAALVLAVLALVLALLALKRGGGSSVTIEQVRDEARREANGIKRIHGAEIALLRDLLARHVGGEEMTSAMVRQGALWREVDPSEAERLVASGSVTVLDVRTPQETAQGIIPGALRIPVDEVENRLAELPREGPLLVYCSSGGRSTDACERLNREGFEKLLNLTGGLDAWKGELVKPEQA